MDLFTPADRAEKRNCQFPSEMLAEVTEPAENGKTVLSVGCPQRIMPDRKAEPPKKRDDAVAVFCRQHPRENGVAGVERNADGHSFTVAQSVTGQDFEAM